MGQKQSFFWIYLKISSLIFTEFVLWWKFILFFVFLHKFHIWENFYSWYMGKNVLSESYPKTNQWNSLIFLHFDTDSHKLKVNQKFFGWVCSEIRCGQSGLRTLKLTVGHVHKYQTQLYISRKLKKHFLGVSSMYLNFRQWNFSHRRKPWLCKYRLHRPNIHSGKS